jgi:RNA 2',3'-cyclic 3'-phosphodiesterase
MTRLFTALVPSGPAVADLSAWLVREGELRWLPTETWHVTLGFYGDLDDQDSRVRWLRERLGELDAPRLRLSGAGSFPGVLWIGVTAVDDDSERALLAIARAVGAGNDGLEFRPHVTVARARRGRGGPPLGKFVELFAGYDGPVWTAEELVLFRSERGAAGPRYTAVERFRLY